MRVRKRRNGTRPPLDEDLILSWADAYFKRNNRWPVIESGPIPESDRDTWSKVNAALRLGCRGLLPDSSLALLLHERRGVRYRFNLPIISIEHILAWADEHYERTGKWPKNTNGKIVGTNGETWGAIDVYLKTGGRGLEGGTTLPKLLMLHRGCHHQMVQPPLTEGMILDWADDHFARFKRWPHRGSGQVAASPNENWSRLNGALARGSRGLAGGSSLIKLLSENRGVRNHLDLADLDLEQLLAWMQAFADRNGRYPTGKDGQIPELPGETWSQVEEALRKGRRGLPKGYSLVRILAEKMGIPSHMYNRDLKLEQICVWMQSFADQHGRYPTADDGPIADAPGENWKAIDQALRIGFRNLTAGSSIAKLKARLND